MAASIAGSTNIGFGSNTAATTVECTVTVAGSSNRAVFAMVGCSAPSLSAPTGCVWDYGGDDVAMTARGTKTQYGVAIAGYVATIGSGYTGSKTVRGTVGSTQDELVIHVFGIQDCDQTDPIPTANLTTDGVTGGGPNSINQTATSLASGDLAISCCYSGNSSGALSSDDSQTDLQIKSNDPNAYIDSGCAYKTGTGTVDVGWTSTDATYGMAGIGARVVQAAAGGGTILPAPDTLPNVLLPGGF